ncbi:restriction endonuclease subunit M [Paraconexibacter algicola]|uniref:site-specific DNA-methyltransferase (adenine-specific) n=2 Tax=Paraconexibacter algicola TaxID=2133960 RepID=A0A2T4UFT9_9ACTN|nr:restriction endonuclease subunit M [Paraconexibacter algicola]
MSTEVRNHANLIWSIAELLRGDYKQADYGKVILPLVVMRRLDQMMEPTRDAVIERAAQLEAAGVENLELALRSVANLDVFNRHRLRFHQLLDDPGNIADLLRSYIDGYSALARQVVDKFEFDGQIDRLKGANLLYKVIGRVCEVDLHPDRVSNADMGAIFEELIRRFAEASNETAGEHYTPREVVRLMVNLLLDGDDDVLRQPGVRRRVFDCACGTGGMLSELEEQIHRYNPTADVLLYGQELNPESYAICLADMLIKGQDATHIVHGNSLSEDGHRGERFHYAIANPPFGVDWSKVEEAVREEHEVKGFDGRFGPGLPRKSDGQLLFLLHLVSKMRAPEDGGGRIAIVHNGSPLFTGAAGSGESEIRRYLLENDLLEAIVALPEQLFYNTGIASYVWLISNRKAPEREGIVQLIDARSMWAKMRKSLGEKRRFLTDEHIAEITRLHGALEEGEHVKLVSVEQFGYRTIAVERPLRARWVLDSAAWSPLPEDKAFAKLPDEHREVVARAMTGLVDGQVAGGEDALKKLVKEALIDEGMAKPPAPLVKALVARCMVRDPEADPVLDGKGRVVADPDLRDSENVPLTDDVHDYLEREVLPHSDDAWTPDPDGKVGYEIPFTRLFYRYTPPRPSEEIKAELREREARIRQLLEEVLV